MTAARPTGKRKTGPRCRIAKMVAAALTRNSTAAPLVRHRPPPTDGLDQLAIVADLRVEVRVAKAEHLFAVGVARTQSRQRPAALDLRRAPAAVRVHVARHQFEA